MSRKNKLAAIHIGKKRLGLDEASYRAKLELITGKRSAGDMSDGELDQVIANFRKDGVAQTRPQTRGKASANPHHAFMRALWISLYHLGAVDDRRDTALDAFVHHQTGIASAAWVPPEQSYKAIEALKEMCGRAGFTIEDREKNRLPHKVQLIHVLLEKINLLEPSAGPRLPSTNDLSSISPADLDNVAGDLGKRLRELKAAAR